MWRSTWYSGTRRPTLRTRRTPRHKKFVEENKATWAKVRVSTPTCPLLKPSISRRQTQANIRV